MTERADQPSDAAHRGVVLWTLLCSGPVVLVLLSVWLVADGHWLTTPVTYAPPLPWMLLPIPPLLLCLVRRRWGMAALNLCVALLAVWFLGDWQVRAVAPAEHPGMRLRVATWNVRGSLPHAGTTAEKLRVKLPDFDADIICLQEVRHAYFDEFLPGYEMATAGDVRTLVRGRVISQDRLSLPGLSHRPILICEVEVDGARLRVANAHFGTSRLGDSVFHTVFMDRGRLREYLGETEGARAVQTDALLDWLPAEAPVIVAGDFNTPPTSRHIRRMASQLRDCFAEAGGGFGMTYLIRKRLPVLRIDYIWAGNGIAPVACRTGANAPSDHRPVIAEIIVPNSPPPREQ